MRIDGLPSDAVVNRSTELDALNAILPFDRREQLAELLTEDDIETLKHLAREGMGHNTMRALASDLGYLEAWCLAATGYTLPWPAPETLLLKFVAQHLWDPVEREHNPDHGMPEDIANILREKQLLKSAGPHAPATVKRRLTSWSILTRWRGLKGEFLSPALKSAVRLAVRANARPRQRKSGKAVTADILGQILGTCDNTHLVDIRDHALLVLAFASGGRRRSEVVNLRVEDLTDEDPVPSTNTDLPPLPCLTLHLGRTKTATADDNDTVVLIGRPVAALKDWMREAKIKEGPIFRRIDQWGNVDRRQLTPQSVNLILKSRIAKAGLDPEKYSAHGLRSGYLTEAANQGIPLPEAMQQSRHKSVTQAAAYYNDATRKKGSAAQLLV